MIWVGIAIGTFFGGLLLVLYQHFVGEPHDRRIALFEIKAEEIRRARAFHDAFLKVWNDITPTQAGVDEGERQERVDEFDKILSDGNTYHLTLLEETKKAHSHLFFLSQNYLALLRGNPNVKYDHIQRESGPSVEALRSALDNEVALFLVGKGFPRVKRQLFWQKWFNTKKH